MESVSYPPDLFSMHTGLFENVTSLSNMTFSEISPGLPLVFQRFNLAVRLVEGTLAVLTNILTITAVIKYSFLRSNTNVLVSFLAFSDLLSGFGSIFLVFQYNLHSYPDMWLIMCAAEQLINMLGSASNVVIIMWISVDRFIYINFPLRYPLLVQRRHVMTAMGGSWFTLISLITLFTTLGVKGNDAFICRAQLIYVYTSMFGIFSNVIFYGASCVTFLLYTQIAYVACKQGRKIRNEQVMS